MATREQIRTAFYDHIEQAVGSGTTSELVPADNISEEEPESDEDYPSIQHSDDYRKLSLNDGSSAPTDLIRDSNGNVTAEVYEKYHEASFGLSIRDYNESRRENIYETVRSYFEKYEDRPWDEADIQPDIFDVSVGDSNSEDDTDASPTVRGDRLIIRLQFTREQERDVVATTTVNTAVDADNDGTTDETY